MHILTQYWQVDSYIQIKLNRIASLFIATALKAWEYVEDSTGPHFLGPVHGEDQTRLISIAEKISSIMPRA